MDAIDTTALSATGVHSTGQVWASDREAAPDPDQLQYIRELIRLILYGRSVTATYNLVLLAILLIFTAAYAVRNIQDRSKWRHIEGGRVVPAGSLRKTTGDVDENGGSSSSSTIEGSSSSQSSFRSAAKDLERQPLLATRHHPSASSGLASRTLRAVRAWLMYQPRPIPLINRTLPSNGTSLFIAAFLGMNAFFHLYGHRWEWKYLFALTDRAGLVFVVNLPLLYLLAAKNQPLKLLTGRSYEALNLYHRRVGELMCFEAFVHFATALVWRVAISPDWLKQGDLWDFLTHPLVLLGLGAFASYELLYFSSLGSFRERCYELFLASHVLLQLAGLVFLWLHFHTSRPYVYAALAIFVVDRLVWRLTFKSATVTADLAVLEDGDTLLLSADWDIPPRAWSWWSRVFRQNIIHGWYPADHVFISVPGLGRSHRLQAHPFTIASAAPETASAHTPTHAWLGLLIRAHSGFTAQLLDHARSNSRASVKLDGPYGSHDPLNMLRASHNAVLIAGGSGIAVIFPLAWALAHAYRTSGDRRTVHLLWVIHSRAQMSWIPQDRIDELRAAGVQITIPAPTLESGRPDLPGFVAEVASSSRGRVGMLVSGPDGFNRSVRNACANAVRAGADIDFRVEKFGW
ncbi:hypothetical protein F4780DRAFT_128659 [Xylariomycetidae sp. FL0641]|nr:hypothetical protein F4780DRAFT_128659 [Xylariomycetidae sp. FL0641]